MSLADNSAVNCSGNPPGNTTASVPSGRVSLSGSNSTTSAPAARNISACSA
ncbi:Uncharacterised protein [Mycobacterium tuberculosis]|nr:Uncharacterised protein [Mycobacterium tuberculosis]COZ78810.1 Uncharacterised protein [Mycobacterium tuberculosis]